ncbi:glycosyltransferase [Sphingobium sp.]|uniref:glycosyltransferase n=1 Tax=Sphingobium sp. TaxID=1912891 RepID=UPI003BB55AEE
MIRPRFLLTMHKFGQGGADRVALLLASGFARAGNDVTIVRMQSGGEGEAALTPLCDPAIEIASAGAPMGSRKLELARGLALIVRRIRAARPHVVLATSNNIGLVTAFAALIVPRSGIRFAFKTTNPVIRPRDKSKVAQWYRRRLYGFIFGRFDCILPLTDAERGRLIALYPQYEQKFHTVMNPYVSDEMLANFTPQTTRRDAPRTIVALARMMPQKRLDLLVSAFARMRRQQDRLVIVGEGPERAGIEALIAQLGLSARVELPGFADDVVPWLRKADLFALSSHYEGLPAAVIEALATNCPVVTTDCFDGAAALLAHAPHCAVVPCGDADALAAALDRGLAYDERPTSLRAIARRYCMAAAIDSHLAVLHELAHAAQAERSNAVLTRIRPVRH